MNVQFQKIIAAILIGVLLTPLVSNLFIRQANAFSFDDPAVGTLIGGLAFYFASKCLPDTGIKLIDDIKNFPSKVVDGLLGGLGDLFGGFTKKVEDTITGKAASVVTNLLSDSVPTNVTNFSESAGQQVGSIAGTTGVTATAATQQAQRGVCDYIGRIINNAIKQQIINQTVNEVIAWINGGGKGPVIVSNWKTLLSNAGNAAVGDLAQEVGAGFLCSPFNLQVQLTLTAPQQFPVRAGCTLDKIVANIQNFYDDFRSGDWLAYQEQWKPQNNYYGATLLALDEADKREDEAKTAAQNEALAGRGFQSQKNCISVTLPNGHVQQNCDIINPGSLVGDAAAEVLIKTPISAVLSAQELSDYVGAIINALINKLTKTGIDKLKSGVGNPAPAGTGGAGAGAGAAGTGGAGTAAAGTGGAGGAGAGAAGTAAAGTAGTAAPTAIELATAAVAARAAAVAAVKAAQQVVVKIAFSPSKENIEKAKTAAEEANKAIAAAKLAEAKAMVAIAEAAPAEAAAATAILTAATQTAINAILKKLGLPPK